MEEPKANEQSSGKDDPMDGYKSRAYNIAKKVLLTNKHEAETKIKDVKVCLLKESYIDDIWRKQNSFTDEMRNQGKKFELKEYSGGFGNSGCFGPNLCSSGKVVDLKMDPIPKFIIENRYEYVIKKVGVFLSKEPYIDNIWKETKEMNGRPNVECPSPQESRKRDLTISQDDKLENDKNQNYKKQKVDHEVKKISPQKNPNEQNLNSSSQTNIHLPAKSTTPRNLPNISLLKDGSTQDHLPGTDLPNTLSSTELEDDSVVYIVDDNDANVENETNNNIPIKNSLVLQAVPPSQLSIGEMTLDLTSQTSDVTSIAPLMSLDLTSQTSDVPPSQLSIKEVMTLDLMSPTGAIPPSQLSIGDMTLDLMSPTSSSSAKAIEQQTTDISDTHLPTHSRQDYDINFDKMQVYLDSNDVVGICETLGTSCPHSPNGSIIDRNSPTNVSSRLDDESTRDPMGQKSSYKLPSVLKYNQRHQLSEKENIPDQKTNHSSNKTNIEVIELDSGEKVDLLETGKEITNELPKNIKSGYNFVFIEMETMKASNSEYKEITQIGAVGCGDNKSKKLFKAIEPKNLNHYLENFKMGGDLLKTLHIQKDAFNNFEFRKQFEILKGDKDEKKCVNEETALESLSTFLESFENCVIISLSEANIELLISRMKHLGSTNQSIHIQKVKRYCSWSSYLQKSGASKEELSQDFDDWYIQNVKKPISSRTHAVAVAKMLRRSIKKSSNDDLYDASKKIESLLPRQASNDMTDTETTIEYLEIANSLRPSCSVTISLTKIETHNVYSDEELDDSFGDLVIDEHVKQEGTNKPKDKNKVELDVQTPSHLPKDTNQQAPSLTINSAEQKDKNKQVPSLLINSAKPKDKNYQVPSLNTNSAQSKDTNHQVPSLIINDLDQSKEVDQHTCPICHKYFIAVYGKNQHIIAKHNPNKSHQTPVLPMEFQCEKCFMWLPSSQDKEKHMKSGKHKEFVEIPDFMRHIPKLWKCERCGQEFSSFLSKRQHMEMESCTICLICHLQFPSLHEKRNHDQQHYVFNKPQKGYCSDLVDQDLHKTNPSVPKIWKCERCSQEFTSFLSKIQHMEKECLICLQQFSSVHEKTEHEKQHYFEFHQDMLDQDRRKTNSVSPNVSGPQQMLQGARGGHGGYGRGAEGFGFYERNESTSFDERSTGGRGGGPF